MHARRMDRFGWCGGRDQNATPIAPSDAMPAFRLRACGAAGRVPARQDNEIRLLLTTLLVAALAWPASAATVAKTYSYFSIGGSTLEEIQRQLDMRGPKVKTTGHRHPGATQMEFTSRVAYAPTRNSCKVAKAA